MGFSQSALSFGLPCDMQLFVTVLCEGTERQLSAAELLHVLENKPVVLQVATSHV